MRIEPKEETFAMKLCKSVCAPVLASALLLSAGCSRDRIEAVNLSNEGTKR